ncbi:MAG TPA: hypothetical protein VFI79_04610 [Gemmatimonadales bacterium]|nr:hypothetical protein [Gemmatimonadales bacterium]
MSALLLLLAALGGATDPKTGDELVRAMHDRYDGKWYHSLTFLQHNTRFFGTDSVQHSTWFERAAIPGKLRIDFRDGPGFSPDGGILFVNDSLIAIRGDTVFRTNAFIHPLMVLGFDVYAQPATTTLDKLKTLGFDLAAIRSDTWQGRPVYVVGAKAGDLHTRQFWVDKERLVFVRMLEPGQQDSSTTSETQFNDYRPFGKGWVSAQVLFLDKGQRLWMEEYDQIQVDVPLTDGTFDAHHWKTTK